MSKNKDEIQRVAAHQEAHPGSRPTPPKPLPDPRSTNEKILDELIKLNARPQISRWTLFSTLIAALFGVILIVLFPAILDLASPPVIPGYND